jgi:hypothetical protein
MPDTEGLWSLGHAGKIPRSQCHKPMNYERWWARQDSNLVAYKLDMLESMTCLPRGIILSFKRWDISADDNVAAALT